MSLVYNGTTVQKIVYNNVDLDEVYYSTTLVWWKPTVYNGSSFGGLFKNGIISAPPFKTGSTSQGIILVPIDQAARGVTYTSGAISITPHFTQQNTQNTVYGGFVTVSQINLTNISKINVNTTIHYRTSYNDKDTYIYLHSIYRCTKDSNGYYVSSGTLPKSGGPVMNGTGNSYHDATGTTVFDCSGVTGSYYLFFNFVPWCEVYPSDPSCKINSITIT